jgi:hypothetical protein
MEKVTSLQRLKSYHKRGFNLVPLKARSKIPLVKWKEYRLGNEDFRKYLDQDSNWAFRCDNNFHALDFDDVETYTRFIEEKGDIIKGAPVVHTGRGYHVWFKPKKPLASFSQDGIEVKGLGSLLAVPPSTHPSGKVYQFEVPPNGKLPEIDVESLFGITSKARYEKQAAPASNGPSDFALRYGKSPYPQSMCGKATKILTRSDDRVKHLVSLRCWKWHCPSCSLLLKKYWLDKLGDVSFRFILKISGNSKPTTFLRHIGKPDYVHIVANGESWLFLTDGDADKVSAEARKAGYQVVYTDSGKSTENEGPGNYLGQALCPEDNPLNTRRKITHSRGLFNKLAPVDKESNESKQNIDCDEEGEDMKKVAGKESLTWESEVVMKPIEEIARDLEKEGWQVLWTSEVEAIAVRDKYPGGEDMDIVELMENVGIKLKKTGSEYMGLCPFHNDHSPSLSVNREKGVWHCFGCGKSGDLNAFIKEWQYHTQNSDYQG